MTNPEGSFEYNDDSVVARVSVDIPTQAVTDIAQLTTAMSAMRTELEAISRAQSSWLDYLQQMPTIVEQSNQALRNQITLMERMSYLQGEIGPTGGAGGGGVPAFSGGGAGGREGGGGAAGAYSTAAPAGYRNPFEGMGAGMGARAGGGGEAELAGMASSIDPRTAANMAAARGLPVNPAVLGTVVATAGGYLGMKGGNGGNLGTGDPDPADSQSPQQGNSERTAGKPSNQNQRGQSKDAPPQDEPSAPTEDSSPMRQAISEIMNGVKSGAGGGMLGKGIKFLAGGGAGMRAARGAGIAAAGLVAAHQVQNIGEDITEYQQLGSVRGGDYMTGIGMEIENRIRALDPFVNLNQTREAMQAAYGAGFYGQDVDEVQSMAITNFKELGISMQDTARTMQYALQGTNSKDDKGAVLEERTKLDAVLNTMKELSADGGAAFPERAKQLQAAMGSLVAMGMDTDTVARGQLELQEGYGDERALKDSIGGISQGVMSSPTLSMMAGHKLGITGVPGALPAKFAKAGISDAQVLEVAAGEMARAVQGIGGYEDKVATFMQLMNQELSSNPLSYEQAEALYKKVTGKQAPSEVAAEKVMSQGTEKNHQTNWNPFGFIGDVLRPTLFARSLDDFKNIPGDTLDAIRGYHEPSENAQNSAELFSNNRPSNQFSPSGSNSVNLPTSASQMPASVNTSGQVSGNITITVNQNGTVSAPQSIQLTGTQKSALTGWGSSQMNNLSPGESHSIPPFGGG